jgi:hypothetical protein
MNNFESSSVRFVDDVKRRQLIFIFRTLLGKQRNLIVALLNWRQSFATVFHSNSAGLYDWTFGF